MRRAVPLRRTPLRPSVQPLRRKARLRPFNPERRARLYERNFGTYSDFIRLLPCAVPDCQRRDIEAAHVVKCRGMGGCNGDKTGLAPLCGSRALPGHHQEQEGRTTVFELKHRIDLRGLARFLWREYGATERFRAVLVSGNAAEVKARWAELAAREVQG